MPSKTPAQAKLMRAVAHGWTPSRIKGPPRKVAKEFVAADKRAKGMQRGGMLKKVLAELKRKQDPDYDPYAKYGTESLTLKQARKRSGKKGIRGTLTAIREMKKAGWTEDRGRWYPSQATTGGGLAKATEPVRTTDPVPGREFIASAAPPRRRAPEDIAPGFRPGRVPPTLLRYLEKARAAAGEEEPVKMQFGGANFMFKGRGPQQAMQQMGSQAPGNWMTQGRVPQGGGGGRGQLGSAMNQAIQKMQRRGQPPGGGAGQGQPRPQPPGAGVPMRGVGRPPGMGGPGDITGGRGIIPPGMGGPGAGGSLSDMARRYGGDRGGRQPYGQQSTGEHINTPEYRRMMNRSPEELQAAMSQHREMKRQGSQQPGGGGQGMMRPAVMPGGGFTPGGGGAGMPGAAPRIGMGDQQGALARASQVQTGRPPMSRRQPFPGRGGPGGGFGRRRRGRGMRGRMRQ